MTVPSPTPGRPSNLCPFRDEIIRLERSQQFGDSSRPECGKLIWFVTVDGDPRVIKPVNGESFGNWLAGSLSAHLDVPADDVKRSINKATAARYN